MRVSVAGFGSRIAPPHVLNGLRALDPVSDLIYLGSGKWMLALLKPSSERRIQASRMLDRLDQEIKHGTSRSAESIRQRARFALLVYAGYQVIDTYEIQGAPDSSIVHDYARALWMLRHKSEAEQMRDAIESAEKRQAQEAAHKDLMDEGRHKDAWRYAFTRSHAVTRNDNRLGQIVPSGRIRHTLKKDAA